MTQQITGGKFSATYPDITTGGLKPASGYKLYTYESGTTTPLVTYIDAGLVAQNTNPVTLNTRGEASVFLGPSAYTLVLKSATGSTIWTQDGVISPDATAAAAIAASATASSSALAAHVALIASTLGAANVGRAGGGATTVQAQMDMMYYGIGNIRDTQYAGGAVGDGSHDDTAAIQACIDANRFIFYPNPPVNYKASTIKLGGTTEVGNKLHMGCAIGTYDDAYTIIGTGVATLMTTGIYPAGDGSKNRNIGISRLSASNQNYPVCDMLTATNFDIDCCHFASTLNGNSSALRIRYSYRGNVTKSAISCSGGGWAITAFDNCNGLDVSDNSMTGGSLGGALHVEQSQAVICNRPVIESSKYGIAVATGVDPVNPSAGNVVGAGDCNGFTCDTPYMEEVDHMFDIGYGDGTASHAGLSAYAVMITGGILSNITPDEYIFRIGRMRGSRIGPNTILRKVGGTKEVCYFSYATGASNTPWAQGNVIDQNLVRFGSGAFLAYDNTVAGGPAYPGLISALYGDNTIQSYLDLDSSGATPRPLASGTRFYTSPTITANVGRVATAYDTTLTGGVLQKVEVIEATGTLGCTVGIGNSVVSSIEQWGTAFDPSTLTLTTGSANVAQGAGGTEYMRANVVPTYVVTAGAGTGSFRLRFTYQVK